MFPVKHTLSQFARAVEAVGNDDIVSNVQGRVANLGLRLNRDGNFQGFGDYMHAKQSKLKHQVHSKVVKKSEIFKGLSFYVDGHTHPPADEIRVLVTENGGEYHHYYRNGTTTYFVAEELASTKVDKVRKEQKIIKPTFITDSIAAGRLLLVAEYYLLDTNNAGDHVNQFFERSRLHLISTMAKELKQYVADMKKNKANHLFTGREKIAHLKSSVRITVPIICHIDMDCFFVSVALRNRPDLVGKPIAITHSSAHGQANGEIASCSYEARAKGCHARQFVRSALQSCPDLICLPYQFEEYVSIAKKLYSIVSSYTLQIQAVSCDELYFDLGSICQECEISDPLALITIIRNDIYENTQCIASAGLGPNALIARMATKKAKPNGQHYVRQEEAQAFIGDAPISNLPTVGWTTTGNIQQQFGADVKLCKHLFDCSVDDLRKVLGAANGEKVYHALRGKCEPIDFDNTVIDQKSISVNVNFGIRFKHDKDLKDTLKSMSIELSKRLNGINKTGGSLTLKLLIRSPNVPIETVKYGGHGSCYLIRKTYSISQTADPEKIYETSMKAIQVLKPVPSDIRGMAIHMTKLFDVGTVASKKPGTIWNFMKIIAPKTTTTADGEATTSTKGLGAFEWVRPPPKPPAPPKKKPTTRDGEEDDGGMDDSFFSPVKEQAEMRMKLSDIFKIMPLPKPEVAKKRAPRKPSPPSRIGQPCLRQIARGKILINGLTIEFEKPPLPHYFRRLYTGFKSFVRSNTPVLEKVLHHLIRYTTNYSAKEEWKPIIASIKRSLNWYSHNYRGGKLFQFEEGPNDDEEFEKFFEDIIREIFPKDRRAASPDMFEGCDDEEELDDDVMVVDDEKDDDEVEITDELINIPSSQESDECQLLTQRGPSTSRISNDGGTVEGVTSKDNSSTSEEQTTVSKAVEVAPTISKPPPIIPDRRASTPTTTRTEAGTSKQNPSTSEVAAVANDDLNQYVIEINFSPLNISKTNDSAGPSKVKTTVPKAAAPTTRKQPPSRPPSRTKAPTTTSERTSKQNSSTSNVNNSKDKPGPSTSKPSTTISKAAALTTKPPPPRPVVIPSRTKSSSTTTATGTSTRPPSKTTTAPSTTTKQKPSTSKKPAPAKKQPLKKQTSFDSGVAAAAAKRKQPALEDFWNRTPFTKKKRISLPSRTMNRLDDSIIIEESDDDDDDGNDPLNQSVIPLN